MSADIRWTEYGPMSSSLKCSNLSDLCVEKIGVQTGPFGSQLHKKDYVKIGTPIITVEHLGDNRIVHVDTPFVSDEDKERLTKYHLAEGDIVFSRVGSVDRRALVRKEEDGWLFSGRCLRVRVDKTKIDPVYLSYFFGLEGFKNYIRNIAVGATMPSINTKILSDVPIYYPECLEEQRKIANIFYTSDEKVEFNRQINQTLEHIAQAIFKSWFVDFEPTSAKAIIKAKGGNKLAIELAAQAIICGAMTLEEIEQLDSEYLQFEELIHPKIIEKYPNPQGLDYWQPQQLKTTAALFPDALVDSELGQIPEGWGLTTVGEHVNVTKGRSYKSAELKESTTALVTLKSFKRGGGYREDGLKEYTGAYKPEQAIKPGELVMSLTDVTQAAEIVGKPAIVTRNNAYETLVASLDVAILRPNDAIKKEFFYGLMSTYRFHRYAESFATGTTVLHLKPKGITSFEYPQPADELCKLYSEMARSMLSKHEGNILLSNSLERLRDSLLPKLLSGELGLKLEE